MENFGASKIEKKSEPELLKRNFTEIWDDGDDKYYAANDLAGQPGSQEFGVCELSMISYIDDLFQDEELENRFNNFAEKSGQKGFIVLNAHGAGDKRDWYCLSGKKKFKTERLVKDMDGKCAMIIMIVCNPFEHKLKTKESMLVYYKNSINFVIAGSIEAKKEVYEPKISRSKNYLQKLGKKK